ncbi:bifunctional ADP-dependent NAD(P)H-hydrate dehydratase/NAD(P)H-hydrate epimerase [Corynebacterium sp. HMSC29G08]|uniref:bifunctional ADP-dependent NAD(P)H-hydrate dehydratase/NAD(P)H-hydrate epimerase n=1 Tax=Corynebacterium sp. HMSC29G08 TaxID=1581069 RepID=UPI0008A42710|nr:bifunctional ADP-dependent NAD(P)H-hydrate dehydratase/NAD(P)H-hydrate epimerase [Corynebacterium sp. HMSC29G08]OFT85180.1 hypothetical protein HMPREF3101_03290 [Corynebacterium sp. HMSC29G08]
MEHFTWTVAQILEAERRLRTHTEDPEAMMRTAASAVAQAAAVMLEPEASVLILAGPGGNGGDGLYAGATLAASGHPVEALLTAGRAHQPALDAFVAAGGKLIQELDRPWEYSLLIDAITGLSARPSLDESLRSIVEDVAELPTLAVDLPSGLEADTGLAGALHITADVTLTFGGWRRAHVLNPACGTQLLADFRLGQHSLALELEAMSEDGELGDTMMLFASRAVSHKSWPTAFPDEFAVLEPFDVAPVTPGPSSDKYTGGVVGVVAGSAAYPGAAVLSCLGAVNATPGMVRYVGTQATEVVRALPEVVAVERLEDCGRVQAWVFGPGSTSEADLRWLLASPEPLLIDATGTTLLSSSPTLRDLLVSRSAPTVLTPHDGEFARLFDAVFPGGSAAGASGASAGASRLEQTLALAKALRCTVVRKGRVTIIADHTAAGTDGWDYAYAVDAGHSWAATPGSGDVLSGLMGARLALAAAEAAAEAGAEAGAGPAAKLPADELPADELPADEVAAQSVVVHALAASLAAATPFGDATAPASRIANFVRDATAWLT